MVKASVIQLDSTSCIETNLDRVNEKLHEAACDNVQLIVLPENFALYATHSEQYVLNQEKLGDGRIQNFISAKAQELSVWIIAGTIPVRCAYDPERVYAASIIFNAEGEMVDYFFKMHLFDLYLSADDYYLESSYFYPGDRITVIDTPVGRIGLAVCYDLRFGELFQLMRHKGAQVMVVPSAFTFKTGQAHWMPLLRARAIENQCYLLAPNQTGYYANDKKKTYGHSAIVDPWGKVISQADLQPCILTGMINLNRLNKIRKQMPMNQHRRLLMSYQFAHAQPDKFKQHRH